MAIFSFWDRGLKKLNSKVEILEFNIDYFNFFIFLT
jgi:hypothetical protein